jgi:UDP-N-acetyl-D-glucosamine dehydrogenase
MLKKIIKQIANKETSIGIIGLGYVGLPLAFEFSMSGFNVTGFDKSKSKLLKLKNNKSYIERLSDVDIKKLNSSGFKSSQDYKKIRKLDIIILCLPTPINKNKTPNMKYINDSIKNIEKFLRKNHIISLESTTYPGTTEEVIAKKIKKKGFDIGENFYLIYSPEREDPGNKKYSLKNTTKIVSGYSENCKILGKKLYKFVSPKIHLTDNLKIAEMAKIFENIYRSINISLVNELKIICNEMNIDVFEVIEAAKTKPFGFSPFYPGPGLGGHCIPIDPFLLSWKAKQYGIKTEFIELSGKINSQMPFFIYKELISFFNKKKLNKFKAKVLLLGASYKKNINDIRETPFTKISEILIKNKISFYYNDPFIKNFRINKPRLNLKSIKLDYNQLNKFEVVIILTDHDYYDYDKILKFSKHIIDTRGRFNLKNINVSRA